MVGWASHGVLYSYLNVIIYCVLIILSFIALIPHVSRWYGSEPNLASFWLRAQGRSVALASRLVRPILRQKSRLLGIDTEPPRA